MLTDYKIGRVTRRGDGVEVLCWVYEGEIATRDEPGPDGVMVPVTRYRRSRLLRTFTTSWEGEQSDSSIRKYLNLRLRADVKRTPISEQVDV